jgi:hypothetical protein
MIDNLWSICRDFAWLRLSASKALLAKKNYAIPTLKQPKPYNPCSLNGILAAIPTPRGRVKASYAKNITPYGGESPQLAGGFFDVELGASNLVPKTSSLGVPTFPER